MKRAHQDPKFLNLILQAQYGDGEALSEILRFVQLRLYRYISSGTKDESLAEDVFQETLIAIYRGLKNLRKPEVFVAWCYRIANRKLYRALNKRTDVSINDLEPESQECAYSEFENEECKRLQQEKLMSMLEKVSSQSRLVLLLHYFEELSLQEISEIQEVSIGTVKSRLAYGLKKMRELSRNS